MSSFDAETADNLEEIEQQFAVKAVVQAETYWSLLEKIPGSQLKLTKFDNDIYEQILIDFPEFKDKEKVASIDEGEMKNTVGKERWRKFCQKFDEIEDYNFGTLLRTNSNEEYSQHGTIFVVRIQFYAIEILRNRYGLNDWVKK